MQLQLADLLSELRRRSKAVVDDDGLQGAMAQYTFLLKVSYVLNAIIWIACFVVCSLAASSSTLSTTSSSSRYSSSPRMASASSSAASSSVSRRRHGVTRGVQRYATCVTGCNRV